MKSILDIYSKSFISFSLLAIVLILLVTGQTTYFQEKVRSVQQSDIVPLWVWNFDQYVSKSHTNCSIPNKDEILPNRKVLTFN